MTRYRSPAELLAITAAWLERVANGEWTMEQYGRAVQALMREGR